MFGITPRVPGLNAGKVTRHLLNFIYHVRRPGNCTYSDNTGHDFERMAAGAGLDDWHIHKLRHLATSFMLTQGVWLEKVSEIIGHASIRVTKDVYGHLEPERLREATGKMGDFLSGLSE